MKKIGKLTMVLFAIVLASPLFGGGKSDSSAGSRPAAAARDLGGISIVVGNWWSNYDVSTYKANNAEEERTLAWRTKIQKDHNFTIVEKTIGGWGEMQELTATSIMAGEPAASVFVLQPNWVMGLYNQGLFAPLSVPSVDLSASNDPAKVNWNEDVKTAFTFGGKPYGAAVGYGSSNRQHGVFFNKRLFREAGVDPEQPYNMQKAGTWTWDAFIDLCKKLTRDTNNDGIMDTYALATFSKDTLDAIVASNGARYVDKDASGKFVNAANRPEFLQAVQFGVRLNTERVLMPQPQGSQWNWFVAAFHDGQAAMRVAGQYVSGDLQDMKDDWGFVVFPKGPRSPDYKWAADENIYVIPSTFSAEDVDKILYGLSLWVTPAPGNTDPNTWKTGQYNRYRDARAVDETLELLRSPKNSLLSYNALIPGLDTGNIAYSIWNQGVDPAQLIESVAQNWNATIAKANGP